MVSEEPAAGRPKQPTVPVLEAPKGQGWVRLEDVRGQEDTLSVIIEGFEGTGKTRLPLTGMPLPAMIANLDRPLTQAHLGVVPKERAQQIFFKNMRESMDSVNAVESVMIKQQMEESLAQNLDWLRGGTYMLDGGTMWREVLKLADPVIGTKMANGQRFNPKDKAAVNAYIAALMSYIQDQGINFVLTCHVAWSWEMQTIATEDGQPKKQLVRTTHTYPKFDDIAFERANVVLFMFKRCECGLNIITQDGTCVANDDANPRPGSAGQAFKHQGRKHMTRIKTNKFLTFTEGSVWEDLDWPTLKVLCSNEKQARALLETVAQ